MNEIEILKNLLQTDEVSSKLKLNSPHKEEVKALQTILYELGYGKELKWEKYGPDGAYGSCTQTAVSSFCSNNKKNCSGQSVTLKTAEQIIYLYDIKDNLELLNETNIKFNIANRIKRDSRFSNGIAALQKLLSQLGYNRQLKWNKYGADGKYGSCTEAALRKFAKDEGYLDSGKALTEKLTETIINKFKPCYGSEFLRKINEIDDELTETISGNNFIISDGNLSWTFRKYKKGVYTSGKVKPKEFINANSNSLKQIGLTESAVNIMISVAENEGNLDAVNTWDNAFLSFGMFQWTLGTNNNAGELPALLNKIKSKNKALFDKYFFDYGLDIFEANNIAGYLQLDNVELKSAPVKEQLRNHDWAFRFWRAGQHEFVQSVEVEHAFSRIKTFYTSDNYKTNNYFISDLIKSEYGVALILDNHVNRPGYVTGCLKNAMNNLGLREPDTWDTMDERKLIKEYLQVRKTYGRTPMTDAERRAAVTRKYLTRGIISDQRGSFNL